ncbi:MAG: hypothetical protein R6V23_09980 [Bacteroidales bacterium]
MKKTFIIVLILIAFTNSCEKDAENNLFIGITETNEFGEIISNDETDWSLNESWNETENSLFSESFDNLCNTDDEYYLLTAYPNPCDAITTLKFTVPDDKRVAFRIVDNDYNILVSKDSANSDIAINFDYLKVQNDILRVYYKIYGENCELKGHGDIKVN